MILQPSDPDTIAFAKALEERFLELQSLYGRIRGVPLPVPKSLDAEMFRWRECAVRHRKGDFRNSEGELKAMRTLASWTLDIQCQLIPDKKREKMPWES